MLNALLAEAEFEGSKYVQFCSFQLNCLHQQLQVKEIWLTTDETLHSIA